MKKQRRYIEFKGMRMNKTARKSRSADVIIILLCLSGAAISLGLFRNDLFQTINSRNDRKPIGSIFIKDNNVQRRMGDRVLWGRLAVESPVYPGDLIRVAELSSATLEIMDNHIDLNENTLIRVQPSRTKEGPVEIELSQGSMDLSSSGSGITLNVMGKHVRVGPGTVLNAAAGDNGMVVQVSAGSVELIEKSDAGEPAREITAGSQLALDTAGREKKEPAVVVTTPQLNARYLKTGTGLLNVAFAWNRINLGEGETLRLELARNRNFSNVFQVISDLDDKARLDLGKGISYWRLLYNDTVLSGGQITVVDASGPALISPAGDQLFSYQTDLPQLRFQWVGIPGASNYNLEVSGTPDFANLKIERETAATSFIDSNLGPGTWYWRVMPVFPSIYEGSAAYSPAASFRIKQSDIVEIPAWPEPVTVAAQPKEQEETRPPEPVTIPVKVPPIFPPAIPKVVPPAIPPPRPAPPPPLSEPPNRSPPSGYRIGIEELRTKRSIDFTWSAVPGANAYLFTLYPQTATSQRQIIRKTIENGTGWTLDDITTLERGTFIWQVEAVVRDRDGTIRRQGKVGENSFTLDIPTPAQPSVTIEGIEGSEISNDD